MEVCYDITMGSQVVGSVKVTKEGLYYKFGCRCNLSGDVMYRLLAVSDGKEYDLGICVPIDNCFGVETKVPIKKIGGTDIEFYITPRHGDIKGKFVPIRADEPFLYLDKLHKAHLEVRNGITGICIDEPEN